MAGVRRSSGKKLGVDPGLAAIAAATVAAIGSLTIALIDRSGTTSEPATASSSSVSSAATITTTSATPASSEPEETDPTTPVTVVSSVPPAEAPEATPSSPQVFLMSVLSPEQRSASVAAATSIRTLGDQLPLVVRDEFDTNDYGWRVGERIFEGGLTCDWKLSAGTQTITVASVNGPAYCLNGLDKQLSTVVLQTELAFDRPAAVTGSLWYRVSSDFLDYYDFTFNPGTQSISLAIVEEGVAEWIVAPTFVAELRAEGSNRFDIIAMGGNHMFYVNEQLVLMVGGEARLTDAGTIQIVNQLAEPNATVGLSATSFILRGSPEPAVG